MIKDELDVNFNGETIRIKHFPSKKNGGIFPIQWRFIRKQKRGVPPPPEKIGAIAIQFDILFSKFHV